MNQKPFTHLRLFALVLTLVVLIWRASPAQAALGITDIQPRTAENNQSTQLTITGTDFAAGAVALLENFGALSTSFINSTVLTAMLPPGLAPGVYGITVVNPDSSSTTLANAITIIQNAATAAPPTATPQAESSSIPADRPLVVIESYNAGAESISPNQEFDLSIKLKNIGSTPASNLVANFPPGDCVPRVSGGVLAITELDDGEQKKFNQPLTATYEILGKTVATVVMQISYTGPDGSPYLETFNMTIPVTSGKFVPTATPTATPTAPPVPRPQLVIPNYSTDISPLQPGTIFTLEMVVENKGNANAKRVSMILGGGAGSEGVPPGTPDAGGISGGGGDFGNFAPVSASNVQFLGDLNASATLTTQSTLIVNASTNPGAYPMQISFSYVDDKGLVYTDDQVITLLVYQLPQVDVNFYRQPDPLFAGQQGMLPVQVVNLGRKAVVLGNMVVDGAGAQYSNNSILVGALDVGGYFTLDALIVPDQPGPLEAVVTINYTDDFNQAQVITRTLAVQVEEMIAPEPIPGEGMQDGSGEPILEQQPETWWQKLVRFIKGMLGLDSSTPQQPGEPLPEEMPPSDIPQGVPAPARPKG